jgi:hypothetical protein
MQWLPPGKHAAICFSIDDIHPGKSADSYDGGGDMRGGALGLVEDLLRTHPKLRATLFTTPDWRETTPSPTRRVLARIPHLRDRVYLTKVLPRGSMRLDRHPEFVRYLTSLPRTEIGLHGLHHLHKGRVVVVEFQNESTEECGAILRKSMSIFRDAGIEFVRGMAPPGWNAPPNLLSAMVHVGLRFVTSARDVKTPIARGARAEMSGLRGVSLLEPELLLNGRLVHFSSNFQATSNKDRAFRIIEQGGLLCIKGHIIKNAMGHVALDGIDALYCNYLDVLFAALDARFGESLWWTSMSEIADRILEQPAAIQATG